MSVGHHKRADVYSDVPTNAQGFHWLHLSHLFTFNHRSSSWNVFLVWPTDASHQLSVSARCRVPLPLRSAVELWVELFKVLDVLIWYSGQYLDLLKIEGHVIFSIGRIICGSTFHHSEIETRSSCLTALPRGVNSADLRLLVLFHSWAPGRAPVEPQTCCYHQGALSMRVSRKGQVLSGLEADWLELTAAYYRRGWSLVDSFVYWDTPKGKAWDFSRKFCLDRSTRVRGGRTKLL